MQIELDNAFELSHVRSRKLLTMLVTFVAIAAILAVGIEN